MFEQAISVLNEKKDMLESQQKCFANKFIFQNDITELSAAIKILEKEGEK